MYRQISYLQICLFAKHLFATPKSALMVLLLICADVQSCEKFEPPDMYVPAEVEQDNALPSCFSSPYVNKHPFRINLMPQFWHFCAYCWGFHCLKCFQRVVLKYCLVLFSARRL